MGADNQGRNGRVEDIAPMAKSTAKSKQGKELGARKSAGKTAAAKKPVKAAAKSATKAPARKATAAAAASGKAATRKKAAGAKPLKSKTPVAKKSPKSNVAKDKAPKGASAKSKTLETKSNAATKSVKAKAAPKKAAAPKTKAAPPKAKAAPAKAPAQKAVKKPAAPKAEAPKRASDSRPALPPIQKSVTARRPLGKPLTREFLIGLGNAIREVIAPMAKANRGRDVSHTAQSGDVTFEMDKAAEKALLQYLRNAKEPVAYYSEDSGYSTFSNEQPQNLLVVDPIDGTRAAKSGFEGCVVSIAATRIIERPTLADVEQACVMELFHDRTFFAERGKGVKIYENGGLKKPKVTTNTDLEMVAWSMTVPARPAELIFPTAARLIDLTSLKGGFFACNSTSYSLTRLVTGQLDACVDFANRYMRDIPDQVRDYFINAGRGNVMGIAPYDLAAALLIAEEAGLIVTDAYGNGFEDVLLLDSSEANQMSLIAASTKQLHQKLMSFFDIRIKQFEALLERRSKGTTSNN